MTDRNDELYRKTTEAKADFVLKAAAQMILDKEEKEFQLLERESRDFALPPPARDKVIGLIQREKMKAQMKNRKAMMQRMVKLCAAIVLVTLIGGSLLINHVEAFKFKFNNFLVKVKTEYLMLSPTEDEEQPAKATEIDDQTQLHGVWYPSYLPEGYEFEQFSDLEAITVMIFEKEKSENIRLTQEFTEGANVYFNNEGDERGEIKIKQQYVGYWIRVDDTISLMWLQNDSIMELTAALSLEELVMISESLIYKK